MKKWKILLVDDEVEFASALAERLSLRGMDAQAVHSGEEALEQIKASLPQVVILDKMMPGLGGNEVLHRIKIDYPDLPVIFLTGQGCTIDGAERKRLGAFDCLVKPLDIDELLESVKAAIESSGSRS